MVGGSADSAPAPLEGRTRLTAAAAADPPVQYKLTGVDLYLARSIARAMGGDLVARSDGEGTGAEFTATMKLVEPAAAVVAEEELDAAAAAAAAAPPAPVPEAL